MQLTLLESDRSFLRSSECAALSIVAHLAIVWAAMASTNGSFRLPTSERDARLMGTAARSRPRLGEGGQSPVSFQSTPR